MLTWELIAALFLLGGAIFFWREARHQREKVELAQKLERARREFERETSAASPAHQPEIFNSMVEGVLILGRDGRVQLINQSLERLFQLRQPITGQILMEALRIPELAQVLQRLETEQTVEAYELELPTLEQRHFEVNAASIRDGEGKLHGTILIFHDVTRIKQLENTRRDFVANVSHELRTPLSMIKGYVETLLDGAHEDPAQSQRFLQIINKHTDRLTYLIEDLLTIARLESGQIVMNLQNVPLRELVNRVLVDLQARAADKQVKLLNELPENLSARADADRLQQVFFNLVENAIKYGPPGQQVTIGSERLSARQINIWIRDHGPGIPPEARERVFERFYRVDRARSRETGGTGLGLAIVKHIVQAHGGEVWVESELGNGATFFFTLSTE